MVNISTTHPETLPQAQRFDTIRKHYDGLGLCPTCAAQATYGHQHGFSAVERPCSGCWRIVARFPRGEVNGWRSMEWQKARQTGQDRALMRTLGIAGIRTVSTAHVLTRALEAA